MTDNDNTQFGEVIGNMTVNSKFLKRDAKKPLDDLHREMIKALEMFIALEEQRGIYNQAPYMGARAVIAKAKERM